MIEKQDGNEESQDLSAALMKLMVQPEPTESEETVKDDEDEGSEEAGSEKMEDPDARFSVHLCSILPDRKADAIRSIRSLSGLDLKNAVAIANGERADLIAGSLTPGEAMAMASSLSANGVQAAIKYIGAFSNELQTVAVYDAREKVSSERKIDPYVTVAVRYNHGEDLPNGFDLVAYETNASAVLGETPRFLSERGNASIQFMHAPKAVRIHRIFVVK